MYFDSEHKRSTYPDHYLLACEQALRSRIKSGACSQANNLAAVVQYYYKNKATQKLVCVTFFVVKLKCQRHSDWTARLVHLHLYLCNIHVRRVPEVNILDGRLPLTF